MGRSTWACARTSTRVWYMGNSCACTCPGGCARPGAGPCGSVGHLGHAGARAGARRTRGLHVGSSRTCACAWSRRTRSCSSLQ
jgi:hypothetical protein